MAETIQILALRPYFCKKSQKEKKTTRLKLEAPNVPDLFKNYKKYLEKIPEKERWNLYFTPAHCKDPSRGHRRFHQSEILGFDIDGIDTERVEDYIKIFLELTGLDRKKTGIWFTGNGLQFAVQLKQPIMSPAFFNKNRVFYYAICDEVNKRMRQNKLIGDCDKSVFDAARLFRFPGTKNIKPPPKGEKMGYMIESIIEPQDLSLVKLSGLPEVPDDAQVKDFNPKKSGTVDANAIFAKDGCSFLRSFREEPETIREPMFYAGLSIIGHMDNGIEIAHRIQEGIRDSGSDSTVAGYSSSEVEKKIEQALIASGPRTCKNVNATWNKCKGCPHFGKITSPIEIKGPDFIATKDSGFRVLIKSKPHPAYSDLIKHFEQEKRFKVNSDNGLVYTYNGTHYDIFTDVKLRGFAYENFDRPKAKSHELNEFVNLVKAQNIIDYNQFFGGINGLVNFQNGILNIKTGEMYAHDHKKGFRLVLPYNYDPSAEAPRFDLFLDEVTEGDKNKRRILEEFGGYSLAGGSYIHHKALLLPGEGKNGKSKYVETMQMVGGVGNYSNVTLDALRNENARQLLEGKLFNICEEGSSQPVFDTKEFKAMTSGATMQVKLMWHQPYFVENKAKIIITCNTLPKNKDSSYGMERRLLIVPFNAKFEGQAEDKHIMDKFAAEKAGIFNIFMKGYRRLMEQGEFTRSESVAQAIDEYKDETNPVRFWLSETEAVNVAPLNGRGTFVTSEELHERYSDWLIGKGNMERTHAVSAIEFPKLFARAIPEGHERLGRKRIGGPKKRGFYDITLAN